jgi:hypothetical protein
LDPNIEVAFRITEQGVEDISAEEEKPASEEERESIHAL